MTKPNRAPGERSKRPVAAGRSVARSRGAAGVGHRTRRAAAYAALAAVGIASIASLTLAGLDLASMIVGAAIATVAVATLVMFVLQPVATAQRLAARRLRRREKRARTRHARVLRAIDRIAVAVDRSERRGFGQTEALGWLLELLALRHPLPATRGMAASPDLLLELVRIVDRVEPANVLELGSGVSTIVIAARLRARGSGRLVSLEDDPGFAEQTRQNLRLEGLDAIATVVDAPLEDVQVRDRTWRWYTLPTEGLPQAIDLLFVDGPHGATGPLARYPALPLLADRLVPGAIIVMDDAIRADEQEIARRWASEHEGIEVRYLPLEAGAAVLTLPRVPPARNDTTV